MQNALQNIARPNVSVLAGQKIANCAIEYIARQKTDIVRACRTGRVRRLKAHKCIGKHTKRTYFETLVEECFVLFAEQVLLYHLPRQLRGFPL
jgi:hypothetical protein